MTRPGERFVAGLQPVREHLRAGAPLREILVAAGRRPSPALDEIVQRAAAAGIEVREVPRAQIEQRVPGQTHQGILAVAPPFPYRHLDDLVAAALAAGDPALLVALDGITDPHNVGSVARTAEAVGAHGLVLPQRRAAGVTPAVEKAAAGALAHLPVAQVPNLARALRGLGKAGVWRVGLAAAGAVSVFDAELLTEPLVLVVGSEGKGLARSSQLHCDLLVSLPMWGAVGSLNASVAAAVALYEVRRRRSTAREQQ